MNTKSRNVLLSLMTAPLVLGACGSSTEADPPEAAAEAPAEATTRQATHEQTEEEATGDDTLAGVSELRETIHRSVSFSEGVIFDDPAALVSGLDLVGTGSVVEVLAGRSDEPEAEDVVPLFNTTFVVAPDELYAGSVGQDGLLYLEFFHSDVVTAEDFAAAVPVGTRLFFGGTDSSDWNPTALKNPGGGRPEGSTDPIYALHSQGLIFFGPDTTSWIETPNPRLWGIDLSKITSDEAIQHVQATLSEAARS